MSDLVTLTELKAYLGDAPATADDTLLTGLITDVQALFDSATGRPADSFIDEDSQVEVLDGTGSPRLYLNYPINALTSVKLGYNSTVPDETLSVTDKTVLVYGVGSRVITRVDGGTFGLAGWPRYVEVAYDNAADIPSGAKLAIMEVVASVYRTRGSEGMKSETVGSFYSYTREDTQAAADQSTHWQEAVLASIRTVLV